MNSRPLLCVDDSPDWLTLGKLTAEPLGYAVITAKDAATAVEILETTSVAAVLVRYKLEGIDAEAVSLDLKQRFPNLTIILLSAFPEVPARTLWLVDDCLMNNQLALLPESIARVQKTHAAA